MPDDKIPLEALPINDMGNEVVDAVQKVLGRPVSILMYIVDDESGEVLSATNFAMEQVGEFLDFIRAEHRVGAFTTEAKQ